MLRRRTAVLAVLTVALVGAVPSPASASGLPPLPAGYENFVPEIDYATLIGGAVTGSGDLACTMGESNIAAFPFGSPFNPAQIQSDLLGKGLQLVTALSDPTKEGVASCTVDVAIPAGTRSITGQITNEALVPLTGTSTGTFSLDCEMQKALKATATVRFGGKVPGKFDVVVTGANEPIPFNCAIAISFGSGASASTLNGSVSGSVNVVEPGSAGVCDGLSTISCAPIRLTGARVVITSSTGRFAGRTGEGTYSFVDSFSLPFVDSKLKDLPGIAKSSVRNSSVRGSSAPRLSPPAMVGASESMSLTLGRLASRTAIARPIANSIGAGGSILVTGTARAACTLTAAVGRKSTRIASFTLTSAGRATPRALSTKVVRAIGAKKNSTVTVTASCRGTNKKTSAAVRRLRYLG